MAERGLLHIKHLDDFRAWLEKQGFKQLPLSRNEYEVLRMKRGKNTVVVFKKLRSKEHLSVMEKDFRLVMGFLKAKEA